MFYYVEQVIGDFLTVEQTVIQFPLYLLGKLRPVTAHDLHADELHSIRALPLNQSGVALSGSARAMPHRRQKQLRIQFLKLEFQAALDAPALSNQFAKALGEKWQGVDYITWDSGCPILKDALACFECKIRHTYEGGDHVILVGEVLKIIADPEGAPLLYNRGKYRKIATE